MITVTYTQNLDNDIISKHLSDTNTAIFYTQTLDIQTIKYENTLIKLCDWANQNIVIQGINNFLEDKRNFYDIANLVKINMWTQDIIKQGIVKPFLVTYIGNNFYTPNNGETRLRSIEQNPNIKEVRSLIVVPKQYVDEFDEKFVKMNNIHDIARVCNVNVGEQMLFEFETNSQGFDQLSWYEYSSKKTEKVTPNEDWCVEVFKLYIKDVGVPVFTPGWFLKDRNWNQYKNW